MKAVKAKITRALPLGCNVEACDNSGAKILRVFGVKGMKTKKGRVAAAGIGDMVLASVVKGRPDMRKQVVFAIIVRQKKEYLRPDGMHVTFEDNAAVVLKDDKGNPKGTLFKGPIAKEAAERWPAISKVASIIL
ncbi:MAG: 50S ribosomal protein L14 [DPANN group archaeon]|nr:50S ribosomal protein L14 [DPANN group archaeon]